MHINLAKFFSLKVFVSFKLLVPLPKNIIEFVTGPRLCDRCNA